MGIWIQRAVLCLGLSVLAVCLVVYFWSATIVEGLLAPVLETREGTIEVDAVRLRMDGLDLRVKRYAEVDFTVEGLTVTCAWSQLWALPEAFGGRLHFEKVHLKIEPEAGAEGAPPALAARVAGLAASVDGWPLGGLEIEIGELNLEYGAGRYRLGAELKLLRGAAGDTLLTAALGNRAADFEVQIKVPSGGEGLVMDYLGSLQDWDFVQEMYLPSLTEKMVERQVGLYAEPLGEGRGFVEWSGYVRWSVEQADRVSATLLADIGATEVYFADGECRLRESSLGLATDGAGVWRGYAKGAAEAVRYGSWMQREGDWAVRLDSKSLTGEFRLGEALSVSLWHADWREALAGEGSGRLFVAADAVDAEWLRALPVDGVPDDLELEMGLELDGRGELKSFTLAEASFETDIEIREASLAAGGVTVSGLRARASGGISGGEFTLPELTMQLAEAALSGFVLSDADFIAERRGDGIWAFSPIEAGFMGGRLRVDATTVNPENPPGLSLRATVESVSLAQLAEAVPQFEGEISGTASGYLVAGWRNGQMMLTDGRLEADPDSDARLSYDVDGLLTRGRSPGSPAYRQYRMAEKAFEDLSLKRFRIEVFPEGKVTRPFRMELFGESVQEGTTVPVDFDLNVNADDTAGLLEILQLMRQGRLDLD